MKKPFLALLLALSMLCMSSCSQMAESVLTMVGDKAEASGADALARQFIDGLLTNDPDKSHAVFVEGVEMAQVLEVFPAMQDLLPDVDSYSLTPISWNSNTGNGVTMYAFQLLLTMGDEQFVVETLQMSEVAGLYNIHIAPYAPQEATVYDHPVIDVIFMLISVATAVFIIWALADCCRHKIHRKWLMVLVILLGNVLLILAMNGSQLNFNLRLGLSLNATSLTLREGGFYLRLQFPTGALIYLLRRKHLLLPEAKQGFAEAFQPDAAADQSIAADNKDA